MIIGNTKFATSLAWPWAKCRELIHLVSPCGALEFQILLFHDIPARWRGAFCVLLEHILRTRHVLTPLQAETYFSKPVINFTGRAPTLLTFDDGFVSNVGAAQEVLDKYGLKGVFFLCPALMEAENQRAAIERYISNGGPSTDVTDQLRLMSWKDVDLLLANGHTIGSHTLRHGRLSRLSEAEKEEQVQVAADILEAHTGRQIRWFAYPFGDVDSIDVSALRLVAQRHRMCCSGIRGYNSAETPPLALLRDSVDLSSPAPYQQMVVDGGLHFLYRKARYRLLSMAGEACLNGMRERRHE